MKKKYTPLEWREKHPRCKFCEYCKNEPYSYKIGSFSRCEVKDKPIKNISMSRPWCKCFSVKYEEKFNKELTANEGNRKI